MYELSHETPNDLSRRILGNEDIFKTISKLSPDIAQCPVSPPSNKNLTVALENCKKSAIELSMEGPTLRNFVNLLAIELSMEGPTLLDFVNFSKYFWPTLRCDTGSEWY